MFSIKIIGVDKSDKYTGYGEIIVNEFIEKFTVSLVHYSTEEYKQHWVERLKALIKTESKTALMVWRHPNNVKFNRRAWVFYKMDTEVFIQDILFPADSCDTKFDIDGYPTQIKEREIYTEEGNKISEWKTSLSEIRVFLKSTKAI